MARSTYFFWRSRFSADLAIFYGVRCMHFARINVFSFDVVCCPIDVAFSGMISVFVLSLLFSQSLADKECVWIMGRVQCEHDPTKNLNVEVGFHFYSWDVETAAERSRRSPKGQTSRAKICRIL